MAAFPNVSIAFDDWMKRDISKPKQAWGQNGEARSPYFYFWLRSDFNNMPSLKETHWSLSLRICRSLVPIMDSWEVLPERQRVEWFETQIESIRSFIVWFHGGACSGEGGNSRQVYHFKTTEIVCEQVGMWIKAVARATQNKSRIHRNILFWGRGF